MLILSELIKQISHGIDIREELFNVSGEAKKVNGNKRVASR